MKRLPEFRLEAYFAEHEFTARHHMTASDFEAMRLDQLLELASEDERRRFETLSLRYTQTFGAQSLREAIALGFESRAADEVLCFSGASEAIFASFRALMAEGDHAIAITPNYQSHEALPQALGAVTGVALLEDEDWALDVDGIARAIRPETRLIVLNAPHNPTGAIPSRERIDRTIELARKHGIWILADEIYHGLGVYPERQLPHLADLYERAISIDVTSKSLGLPGLRVGWAACADRALLARMEKIKHYLSICNAGPSEVLAEIALRNRETILARNNALLAETMAALDGFFARWPDRFEWRIPDGGCIAFPRYLGEEGVEAFAETLLRERGVLLLPASIFASDLAPTPTDRFRISAGRRAIAEGLAEIHRHLERSG